MNQLRMKSSRIFVRTVALFMTFAMFSTLVLSIPMTSEAKAVKVSSVKVFSKTLVLKSGASMKLKPTVKVSPNKSTYKKVTYKSSNSKVVSVSSTGVIKATGKKGKAKITITSKQNTKKKVVVTVKIGKRVKSIKFKSKTVNMEVGDSLRLGNKKFKLTYSPKKPTSKKVSLSSKNRKIATVNSYGILTARRVGKTTITATAKDGSGKKAKCTVIVSKASLVTPTPAPTRKPDNRKKTMVENFESYPIGTKWNVTTGGYKDPVTATVVQDPTNSKNKVLKIAYDGTTQAYDVEPYFTVDLSKVPGVKAGAKLGDFVGINFKTKVESNSGDCRYKNIVCYFADAGKLKPEYFAGTNDEKDDELHKYWFSKTMAKGEDLDYTDTDNGKKDNQKSFPMYYDGYAASKSLKDATPGFAEVKGDKAVPFVERYLDFQNPLMKEPISGKSLLSNTSFDFMFGSTFSGQYVGGYYLNLYIDDVTLLSNVSVTPLKEIQIKEFGSVGTGLTRRTYVTLLPADTTQKGLKWTSSDPTKATVDEMGNITGVSPTEAVTITATSEENPSIKKEITVKVFQSATATENAQLDISKVIPVDSTTYPKTSSDLAPVYTQGEGLRINYTKANEAVVIDLGREMDFSLYKSIEITGKTPANVTFELYDEKLDKSVDNWWLESQGVYYPFHKGSCSTRLEDGGFDTASGKTLTKETQRISWNSLCGTDRNGDFTKIRYIVLKSQEDPVNPSGWSGDNYLIESITLSTRDELVATTKKTLELTELNEAASTSKTKVPENNFYAEFPFFSIEEGLTVATFNSNSADNSGMAFYVDSKEKKEIDLSEYRYIKVWVEAEENKLGLVMSSKDKTWTESIPVLKEKSALNAKQRMIYFSLKSLAAKGIDLTKIETLGIKSGKTGATVKISLIRAITGEPLIQPADEESTYIVN